MTPFCSVILPCRNEIRFIEACLASLLASDYPAGAFEIIAVDGASTDGTRDVLARVSSRHSQVRVLDNPNGVIPVSMNLGIRHARGEAIFKADAHSTYSPDYLRQCVAHLTASGADNVGGILDTCAAETTVAARAIARVLSHPFGSGNSSFRIGTQVARDADTVAFGCYRRSTLERLGGYNEALRRSSDLDLNTRIRHAGGRIVLVPDIITRYYPRTTLGSFAAGNLIDGFWATYPLRFGGRVLRARHAAPLAALVALVVMLALAPRIPAAALAVAIGGAIYASAAIAASAHIGWRERSARVAAAAAAAFVARHAAYALGSAWGLWCAVTSRAAKRAFDIGAAAAGLLVLAPVLLIVAAAVWLDSGAPVLYRGRRVGLRGRAFAMLKFRTMCRDAHLRGAASTPADDDRITRVGRVLRRFKLDELPQLLNVLSGDMSLVGPRPEVESAVRVFADEYRALLSVRPGITDFASIRFANEGELLRGSADPDRDYREQIAPLKLRLGLEYVRTQSFALDVRIILATLWAIVCGDRETVLQWARGGRAH